MKLWQGLGYYSRARNLHKAAKTVVEQHNGAFPETYKEILALPGIGPYTAAAISSICFGLPHAVVDGNVYRVLSRIYGIEAPIDTTTGQKMYKTLAGELLDVKNPGNHNQAVMEFGALQCTPAKPDCSSCPMLAHCIAYSAGTVANLPVKARKQGKRDRFFNYLVVQHNNQTLLRKRTGKGIWQNLYEFPLIETPTAMATQQELLATELVSSLLAGSSITVQAPSKEYKHILSHQRIFARFWPVQVSQLPAQLAADTQVIKTADLHQFAVPRLIDLYLHDYPL